MLNLTVKQRKAVSEAARQELCRRDYLEYCKYVHHGKWIPAKHHKLICDALQKIAEGKLTRLMLFLPPRHSKSMTVTETFPSYFLGHFPDKRVITVSYGASLAERFGKLNRRKVEEFGKTLFNVELSSEKASKTDWDIAEHSGGMLSTGIEGSATGFGADLLLIDDPIKNQQDADSAKIREKVWNEWQSTFSTRLHAGAAVIVILTRWHEDDLAGRLLNPEFCEVDNWKIIKFPSICEDVGDNGFDELGRRIGDPLWPEQGYGIEWAEAQKRKTGSRTWNALYQQRPAPQEGSIIKRHWWKFYDKLPPHFEEIIQSWDCTFKDSKDSDYVVGQVWGRLGADKYLIDQVRDRLDFIATINAIVNMSDKWPKSYEKLIEDKANGPAVITTLQNKISGLIPINPEGSKVSRVQSIVPQIESGNVYIPNQAIAPWINDFIEECAAFPGAAHDDQIDAMSQALSRLETNIPGTFEGLEDLL